MTEWATAGDELATRFVVGDGKVVISALIAGDGIDRHADGQKGQAVVERGG